MTNKEYTHIKEEPKMSKLEFFESWMMGMMLRELEISFADTFETQKLRKCIKEIIRFAKFNNFLNIATEPNEIQTMTNSNDFINPLPLKDANGTIQYNSESGLTKREYFAAMAMQGMLSGANTQAVEEYIPRRAVILAVDLIRELNKIKP